MAQGALVWLCSGLAAPWPAATQSTLLILCSPRHTKLPQDFDSTNSWQAENCSAPCRSCPAPHNMVFGWAVLDQEGVKWNPMTCGSFPKLVLPHTRHVGLSWSCYLTHTQVLDPGLANWKGKRAGFFFFFQSVKPSVSYNNIKNTSWETSEKVDIAKLLLESKLNVTAWFVFTVGQPQDCHLNTKGKAGSWAWCKWGFTSWQPRQQECPGHSTLTVSVEITWVVLLLILPLPALSKPYTMSNSISCSIKLHGTITESISHSFFQYRWLCY